MIATACAIDCDRDGGATRVYLVRVSIHFRVEHPPQLIGPRPPFANVLSAQLVSRPARVGSRFASWESSVTGEEDAGPAGGKQD